MHSHREYFFFLFAVRDLSLINGLRIWSSFIPFPSYQVFQRGAYYSVEVIPDKLAVISLNTMYFYDSNKGTMSPLLSKQDVLFQLEDQYIAVEGCEYNDPDDPGNLEFDWLEVQLEYFRDRHMQVRRRCLRRHDRQLIVSINTRA